MTAVGNLLLTWCRRRRLDDMHNGDDARRRPIGAGRITAHALLTHKARGAARRREATRYMPRRRGAANATRVTRTADTPRPARADDRTSDVVRAGDEPGVGRPTNDDRTNDWPMPAPARRLRRAQHDMHVLPFQPTRDRSIVVPAYGTVAVPTVAVRRPLSHH